jgi:glutaredoxin 3
MARLTEERELFAMAQVRIYTTSYCPYCRAAKALLRRKAVQFEEIDVTDDPQLRAEIEKLSRRMTVPQIFIGATHVGGCDDLYALDDAGKLDPLLLDGQGG